MPFRYYPRKKKPDESQDLFAAPAAPRPEAYLVAHIDGGARGNPGPAGYGVVISDRSGQQLAGLSKFLGHQTNNFAEYAGLLAALHYALEHGYRALEVVSDSELLVRQINGQYKVRSPILLDLYRQAKSLIGKLEWFRIGHVLRAKNKVADALANRAMDQGMGRSQK